MNWAALLLIGLGVLGLGMAVTGGYAPLAKLLFGVGVTPPTPTQEPNPLPGTFGPNGNSNTPQPSGQKQHDPGVTMAWAQLQAALSAYAPGSVL